MATQARNWPSDRLAGAAGLLGIGLPALGLFVLPIWAFPGTSASPGQLAEFLSSHKTALPAVMVLNATGVALWQLFGAGVWARLRGADAEKQVLATSFALGLVSLVTLLLAGFLPMFVLAYRHMDMHEVRLAYDLCFGLLAISGLPTAIALASFATLSLKGSLFPAYTGWLAALTAVAHVVLAFSLVIPKGFFSLEGQVITVIPGLLFAWIVGTSISMVRVRAGAS